MREISDPDLLRPPNRHGRLASFVALAVALIGLGALWIAGLSAQATLDRGLREIERGALPSMIEAHDLALGTGRLRVHVEGLLAAEPGHRRRDRSAITGDLAALHSQLAALRAPVWGPGAVNPIRDLRLRIEALQAEVAGSEAASGLGERAAAASFNALTASLQGLLADCDSLVALEAREAELDSQGLQAHSRQARNLQFGTAAVFAFVLIGLVLLAEAEHRRHEREIASDARVLRELNAELNAFCGRVAHDLLSPLTPIRGNAQLIARGVDPARSRELGARIVATTVRLQELIDGLLSLARSQSNPEVRGLSDAAEVATVLLAEMRDRIETLRAEVRLSVQPTPVRCSPSLLSSVLQNLLDNAFKYGRSEGRPPRITIAVRPGKTWGSITVSDEGPGISPEAQARIFEPYFQEHPGHGGLGLGLATTRQVLESCGGSIRVQSLPGAGATFEILLPLVSRPVTRPRGGPPADVASAFSPESVAPASPPRPGIATSLPDS